MPSPRSIALIALFIGIAATGLWMRDKTIRKEQMTAQYQLGYYKAQMEMVQAATDAGRTSTRKFRDETIKNRALSRLLNLRAHGFQCPFIAQPTPAKHVNGSFLMRRRGRSVVRNFRKIAYILTIIDIL
jgi:hypothetical protein